MNEIIKNVLSDLDLLIEETNAMIRYEHPLPAIKEMRYR
jgi:hypothetical protein